MITFKIQARLYEKIRADLRRPHAYANERVGFLTVGSARTPNGLLLLAQEYWPIADDHYVDNPNVGAEYDERAIRVIMELAYNQSVGIFHVHEHPHNMQWFSNLDLASIPQLVYGLFSYSSKSVHGAVLLTDIPCNSMLWLPGASSSRRISQFQIIGKTIVKINATR